MHQNCRKRYKEIRTSKQCTTINQQLFACEADPTENAARLKKVPSKKADLIRPKNITAPHSKTTMVGNGFNRAHGSNIELLENRRVARRYRSFANAIAFSHRPLIPGETFVFEIEEQEIGWAGHIRCGVTAHNPKKLEALPQYLLPDFAQMNDGRSCSWVYAIKPNDEMPFGDDFNGIAIARDTNYDELSTTKNQKMNYKLLKSQDNVLPTDVGSRIGIHVSLNGELFFYVNGTKFGPCALEVPVDYGGVFAVVDLYGVTKQIRVIQVEGEKAYLQSMADTLPNIGGPKLLFQLESSVYFYCF